MTSSWDDMFNDIIEWFLGRAGDRRQYQRRAGAFRLQYFRDPKALTGPAKDGIGLEVSPNGIMFIIGDELPSPEYSLNLKLSETTAIPVHVKTVRSDTVQHQGRLWYRYMCEFTGIAAEHWDMVVRYVTHQPEFERPKPQSLDGNDRVDDAFRLFPLSMQQRIVDVLVAKGRLLKPKDGETPNLKLFYGGRVNRAGQAPAHRFNVHSRVPGDDGLVAYDSRFLVTDEGDVTLM